MNIVFLTSGHYPLDDRIFYHMAKSLSGKNHVEIISSKLYLKVTSDGIKLNCFAGDELTKREKTEEFIARMKEARPDIIICSEPLVVYAAKKYSKSESRKIRIIYDITEWYPSKKNLAGIKWPLRPVSFLKLMLFNFWLAGYAGSFIFGEWYKSKTYRLLYPLKRYIFIPYYPDLGYVSYSSPELQNARLRLVYSGKISAEKGYNNFFSVLKLLSEKRKDLKIDVRIIGWYETARDKEEIGKYFDTISPNVSLTLSDRLGFNDFLATIKETDIFLDLRSDDFENQHCLPIKLFYYAALGRPVIFSDLKAIRKEVEIEKFGFLVKPGDRELIVKKIIDYLEDNELYYRHCTNARHLAEEKYNWQIIEPRILEFITSD